MAIYSSYTSVESALTLSSASNPTQPRLFLLQPTVVFAARVVLLDPAEYPISFVAYDTVTTGAYTDIKVGQTILLGSSAGADDYGRQRVRGPTTPATAISIFVGRSSQGTFDGELTIVNDAYITIWDDRRLWMKAPFIDADVDGQTFKDSDLEVEWRTTTPPPVAVMGQGFAATIDEDTSVITVLFNGQNSYATADGATITDYEWDIADGSLIVGTLTTDNITVTFPAGFRYVKLTVTDSNSKTAFTERPVYARDPDDDTSFDGFDIESQRITDAGVTMTIRALENMPRATYPDGTLAMIWGREPGGTADRTHMLIVGWLDVDDASHNAGRTGLLRDTTLTILDVAAKLDTLPGLPQALADDETRDTELIPDITWNYMVSPTMDKYAHYLWAWHSTALEVADFIWSGTGDAYAIAIKSSDGDSLWNQVARLTGAMCPGYVLTCDQAGAIRVVPDPMLQELADRTSVVQVALSEDMWSDLRFTYQRAPRTHWLRTGALVVQSSISFNADGTIFLPTVFSRSPGATPGQGLGEVDNNEQLAADQATLNNATGHRYARMNSPYGLLTVTLIQDDASPQASVPWREIEPALKEWVEFTLSASNAAQRGLSFTSVRCLPKEVSIRYNHSRTGLTHTIDVTLEIETSGQPGATELKPTDIPGPGDQPATIPDPIPPPDMGLVEGQQLVAGIGTLSLYRTGDFQTPSGSGGPTWEAVALTADATQTWVVDPFSPGYLTGAGAINGWRATTTKIYRMTDLFGSFSETSIVTFATTALWRTIQASFGTYFVTGSNPWLICISYYGSTGGHTGTWCTYSKDGGATWAAEVLVSSFYDSGGASNPIGLYASPKTPGLAYTIAHTETANPAETGGYKSVDWGETWVPITATEDPIELLPGFGEFDDNNTGTYTYLGPAPSAAISDVATTSTTPVNVYETLIIAPPEDTKRMVVRCDWTNEHTKSGGFGGGGSSLTLGKPGTITRTGGSNYTQATLNAGPLSGSFSSEYTFATYLTDDWPGNRQDTEATPPTTGSNYVRYIINASASVSGGNTRTVTVGITLTVTEIELDSGQIYTPTNPGIFLTVNGQAGTIHIPWESNDAEDVIMYGQLDRSGNRLFALMRATSGVVDDISPNDGSKDYGINAGAFSIRAHDSDRQLILAAVTGNDTTTSAANDKQGVYASDDGGDTWTAIVAPTTGTEVYQAAWSGDLDGTVFVWGPATYMGYSTNSGVAIDSRAGNLSALSATRLIGLAGGPTP